MQEERAPTFLIVGRICAVIGMSFAAALAILFLVGGFFVWALVSLVAIVPFVGLMRVLEVAATRGEG